MSSDTRNSSGDIDITDIDMNTTIRAKKQKLRKEIRSKLKALSKEEISSQSTYVWSELYNLPQYQSAKSVGLFLSMPKGEIHTDGVCQQVLNDGKDLYVPRVGLDFEQCDMDMIKVKVKVNVESNNNDSTDTNTSTSTSTSSECNNNSGSDIFHKDWPRNKWGIPEAPSYLTQLAQPGELDLIIVPGLGFDRDGGRLGQGKGYYDRFITKMSVKEQKRPFLIAVGLEPSFVEGGIPVNDHDCQMDMLILPQIGAVQVSIGNK
eukprot:CAMPEP_0203671642 /NCGR_PEP_ID=MMETSP0090-20130426/7362_1 /ASSEMBLY_ACC=CAM_ASM_001088 /TAXON_ID=426623 /ORGANISM="Chaetoceros affinis, Strain CCMP159" /LENGTH=261 /DNA_ID=CAMNT_0050536753 /DNA_START=226 /DNA_END=1011 /DNA_ORIENTATION=+